MIEVSSSEDTNFLKVQRRHLTGEAKWRDIEDLINRWARRNKRGAWELEQWIKETRAGLFDKKHGKMTNEAMANGRIGVMIHPELMQYIQAFYPKFLDDKDELHEFMKRFPKFKIRELV